MNCDVTKDLLPLYIDKCCSEESAKLVAAHLEGCSVCRRVLEQMRQSYQPQPQEHKKIHLHSISSWKASLLQSVLLFISFAVLALGVILEGNTPTGETNGLWAVALIVPATGYLLSIANMFFVRIYKSRKKFSNGSCFATLVLTILGYVWAALHYSDDLPLTSPFLWWGIALAAVFCVLSKVLSNWYALLLGRE